MIDKNTILNCTDGGLAVFRHYLKHDLIIGRKFRNPFYHDTIASCNVYYDKRSGCYKYKDFGNEDYGGDCFDLVAQITGLNCDVPKDFMQILATINRDLGLGLSDDDCNKRYVTVQQPIIRIFHPPKSPLSPRPYSYIEKPFTRHEIECFRTKGFSLDLLKRYLVVSLSEYRSENREGKPFILHSSYQEPMFGYIRPNGIKIYRPLSKSRFLFGGTYGDYYCFGLEQLPPTGDLLFITGGEKDVLSLAAHGFPAICFGSETAHIPSKQIEELSGRFSRIAILYDTDKTGLKESERMKTALQRYNVGRILLPLAGTKQEKDISDYFRLGFERSDLLRLCRETLGMKLEQLSIHKHIISKL